MKLRNNKKGFTIVELVIVIAVIGVLAAVLVPTFVNLTQKANEAAGQSLVKNLNTALAMEAQEAGHKPSTTLQGAVDDLEKQGYLLENLAAKSGKDLLWNQEKNEFVLNKEGNLAGKEYWKIVNQVPNTGDQKYSYYAGANFTQSEIPTIKYGFDAGKNKGLKFTYGGNGTSANIRSYGDLSEVTIDAQDDDVNFYGFAGKLSVTAVKNQSLHIHGSVNALAVTKGHVAIEDTGIVFNVTALNPEKDAQNKSVATISNYGYVADAATPEIKQKIDEETGSQGKPVGGDYEIDSLSRLEAFRDSVNSGNDFLGKKVKLAKDIELNNGWTPIGEGARSVGKTKANATAIQSWFRGSFDGQNHKISNLNNIGFKPSSIRLVVDKVDNVEYDTYAYGLFGLVGQCAEIKDLTLDNVNIDTASYTQAIGDSVGALIGFTDSGVKVSNITVNGSVKGSDAVGGIIGRSYFKTNWTPNTDEYTFKYEVKNCTNNANVSAGTKTGQKGSGVIGYLAPNKDRADNIKDNIAVTGNTNNGTITGGSTAGGKALKAAVVLVSSGVANRVTIQGNKNGTADANIASTAYESTLAVGELA